MNMGEQIPVQVSALTSLGSIPRNVIAASYGKSMINVLRTVSKVAAPLCIPTNNVCGFQFSTSSPTFVIVPS